MATQSEIIIALIKKNQEARAAWSRALDANKVEPSEFKIAEVQKLETIWNTWAVTLEQLGIILAELNRAEINSPTNLKIKTDGNL